MTARWRVVGGDGIVSVGGGVMDVVGGSLAFLDVPVGVVSEFGVSVCFLVVILDLIQDLFQLRVPVGMGCWAWCRDAETSSA